MKKLTVMLAFAVGIISFIMPSFAQDVETFNSGYQKGGLCFYELSNFKGRKFCARKGEKIKRLSGKWNKNFSSLRLDDGVSAVVCSRANFQGNCRVYSRARARLGDDWNDNISSVHIARTSDAARLAENYERNREITTASVRDTEKRNSGDSEDRNTRQKDRAPNKPTVNLFDSDEDRNKKKGDEDRNGDTDNGQAGNNQDNQNGNRQAGVRQNNQEGNPTETTEVDSPEICFYERRGFRGRKFCVNKNQTVYQLSDRWDDNISSISIKGNAVVELCEDSDLEGECIQYGRDQRFIGWSLNNQVTSLRVKFRTTPTPGERTVVNIDQEAEKTDEDEEEPAEVCFYERRKFRGRSMCIPVGQTVRRLSAVWDNNISSIKVSGDVKVRITVCEDVFLGGECRNFYRTRKFVGWPWNDRISSLRVRIDRRGTY